MNGGSKAKLAFYSMNIITEDQVYQALSNVIDPDLHEDIVTLGFIKELKIQDNNVSFEIELTTPACPFKQKMRDEAESNIKNIPDVKNIDITLTSRANAENEMPQKVAVKGVKHVIAVASGKGGVGKSTVSVNIALALAQTGAKVGLLDADIYGPSIPLLLGVTDEQLHGTDEEIYPVEKYGIKVVSMGFLLPREQAVIWRGPMLDKMVNQFLMNVVWGEIDYLIVDLPPGTGDVQLGLCQQVNITGAVVVSTPQEAAWSIAQKAISMFRQLHTPILGLIENMSYYVCPHCDEKDYIFGIGGTKKLAEELRIDFLGEIPLSTDIRSFSDYGNPIVIAEPESYAAKAFKEIVKKLTA